MKTEDESVASRVPPRAICPGSSKVERSREEREVLVRLQPGAWRRAPRRSPRSAPRRPGRRSSARRAPALHAGGWGCDSPPVHRSAALSRRGVPGTPVIATHRRKVRLLLTISHLRSSTGWSARLRTGRLQVRFLPGVLSPGPALVVKRISRERPKLESLVRVQAGASACSTLCLVGERLSSYGSTRRFDPARSDRCSVSSACSLVDSGTPFGAETTQVRVLSCRLSLFR